MLYIEIVKLRGAFHQLLLQVSLESIIRVPQFSIDKEGSEGRVSFQLINHLLSILNNKLLTKYLVLCPVLLPARWRIGATSA